MVAVVESKAFGGGWAVGINVSKVVGPLSIGNWMTSHVSGYIRNSVHERFASEGDEASGGPWAPLSPITVRIRKANGYPGKHPINRVTGEMYDWATTGAGDMVLTPTGASYQFPGASNAPTGVLRSKIEGAQFGGRGAPPRPIIALSEADIAILALDLNREMQLGLNIAAAAARRQMRKDQLFTAGPAGDPFNLDARFGSPNAGLDPAILDFSPTVRVTQPVINKSGRRGGLGPNFRGIGL